MKNKIKDFLLNENRNIFRGKNGLLELDNMYQEIFEFIEESIDKSTNSLQNYNIIDEQSAHNRKERARELANELKTICLENSKTSFLIWNQANILKEQDKKIKEQEIRIENISQENQDLNKRIYIAENEIHRSKEEVEKTQINTLKDLEKDLDNTRKDLISIGRTAEKFKELEAQELDDTTLGNIQNNILGNLDNIIENFKNLKLWPEYEELPTFEKSDKVKAKRLKKLKKKTIKEDAENTEDNTTSADNNVIENDNSVIEDNIETKENNSVESVQQTSLLDLESREPKEEA